MHTRLRLASRGDVMAMHWSERLPRDEFESHVSSEDYQVS